MFSKNNPQYFEHKPHIQFSIHPNGTPIKIALYSNVKGYSIAKFEFINCSNFRITENFMSWFTQQFLMSGHTDDFMFQISMSTAPADLQHRLTQLQGTN